MFERTLNETVRTGTYVAGTQVLEWNGGMVAELDWSADPLLLVGLRLEATWQDDGYPLGLNDLRLAVRDLNATRATDHYAHGPVEGPSPLRMDIARVANRIRDGPLALSFGMSQNTTSGAAVAITPIAVQVLITETYDLCAP